jgi:hypothetical protein
MNYTGLVAALAAFCGIWLGHVSVRKIEYHSPSLWLPAVLAALLGLGLEAFSLTVLHPALSLAAGILGITVLWDALEFFRQQARVKLGHAPANPHNPRHARILAEYPSATVHDLLKRQPSGMPVGEGNASLPERQVEASEL